MLQKATYLSCSLRYSSSHFQYLAVSANFTEASPIFQTVFSCPLGQSLLRQRQHVPSENRPILFKVSHFECFYS